MLTQGRVGLPMGAQYPLNPIPTLGPAGGQSHLLWALALAAPSVCDLEHVTSLLWAQLPPEQ